MKLIVLFTLFLLCNGDGALPKSGKLSDSYGTPIALSDSYGAPTNEAQAEPVTSSNPKGTAPISNSASFNFLSELFAPSLLSFGIGSAKGTVGKTGIYSAPAAAELLVTLPGVVPPINTIPLPPVIPPVQLPPNVLPPVQIPIQPLPIQSIPIQPIAVPSVPVPPVAIPSVPIPPVSVPQVPIPALPVSSATSGAAPKLTAFATNAHTSFITPQNYFQYLFATPTAFNPASFYIQGTPLSYAPAYYPKNQLFTPNFEIIPQIASSESIPTIISNTITNPLNSTSLDGVNNEPAPFDSQILKK